MAKLRNIIYVAISIPVFLMLVWLFAIPDNLIREKIEDAIATSGNSNMGLSINGLKKGIFFIIYADRLKLEINNRPALEITYFFRDHRFCRQLFTPLFD
jgi:hypothetical protein